MKDHSDSINESPNITSTEQRNRISYACPNIPDYSDIEYSGLRKIIVTVYLSDGKSLQQNKNTKYTTHAQICWTIQTKELRVMKDHCNRISV